LALPSTSGSLLQANANNPVLTSCVSQPSTSSRKVNFNVKIINPRWPVKKKEFETYVLRDVNKNCISTPTLLRKELLWSKFGVLHLAITKVDFVLMISLLSVVLQE